VKIVKNNFVTTSILAIEPPIFQLPATIHPMINVSKLAVILQVYVFKSDLLCGSFLI